MKLRCIESCNKRFIVNKEYEAVKIKTDYENHLYRMKDEDNIKVQVVLKGLLWKFEIVKENEMKELTLQQAFECEVGTKFKVIYEDGSSPENKIELCKDENEIISFVWDDKDDAILTKSIMTAKFIPIVEKEVSFTEAVKAFRENKVIKCVFGEEEYFYNGENEWCFIDNCNNGVSPDEILKGKWYIID